MTRFRLDALQPAGNRTRLIRLPFTSIPSIFGHDKILIIDDEKPIRGSLREILEYEKYTIEEAADGEEGLKMIAGGQYDFGALRYKMPNVRRYRRVAKGHG